MLDEWMIEDRDEQGEIIIELPELLPEDFAVVGFDNYLYPGLPDRVITTYEVNMKRLVEIALKKVISRIEDPQAMHCLDLVTGHIVENDRKTIAIVIMQNKYIKVGGGGYKFE